MAKTIQIRDIDDQTYTVLRTRAAADHLSLAAYLRRHLEQLASAPTMAELLERADRRRARGVSVSGDEIIAAVRAARDEGED
ncbi:MAG TPA: antitoxin [Pseudonocardiaceae bacterium]|nr:antitoxin [Pseudonocardiaceae bacterium]